MEKISYPYAKRGEDVQPWMLRRNTRMCLLFHFLLSTFFGMPFIVVYYETHGLSQVDINSVQSVIAVTGVLVAVPSGYLADRFGTRRAMMYAALVIAATALTFWLCCDSLWEFALNSAVSSLGWRMFASAPSAHMTATVDAASRAGIPVDKKYDRFESHAVQADATGMLFGIGAGSVMVVWSDVWLTFALQPITYCGAIWAAWRLVEPASIAAAEPRQAMRPRVMWEKADLMLRQMPVIRWLIVVMAVLNITVLGSFWLFQPKLKEEGVAVALFGAVYILRAVGTIVFVHVGKTWMSNLGTIGGLRVIVLALSTSLLLAVYVGGWLGLCALFAGYSFAMAFLRQIERVALRRLLPRPATNRACELAVSGMVQSLAFACASPLFGVAAETFSVDFALVLVAAVCLVGCRIGLTLLRRLDA